MSRTTSFIIGFGVLSFLGCHGPRDQGTWPYLDEKNYSAPLPPGQLALRKIDPSRYPDFGCAFHNRTNLEQAVQNSLAYLSKPSSKKYYPYGDITHERAVSSLHRFQSVLSEVTSPETLRQTIERDFDVYQSVGCDDRGTVFFTGYYCPIFEGRKQPDARFRYPLYKCPPDLVKDEEGRILGRKTTGGGTVPYHTRRQLEEGRLLKGQEIAWLKDPFEAYVATVQGSAKIRLQDGSIYELGYSANNGHEYTPVAEAMIKEGVIKKEELSLQTLLNYFAAHPQEVPRYCWRNDRYVFFKEAPGGPFGSINVPVTPFRSIATDKEIYPRACLAFVDTKLPMLEGDRVRNVPYAGFALDQDTGGAIRAAGRCDIFMGTGPQAEGLAGRTGAEGGLYYLFVKTNSLDVQRQTTPEAVTE